MILANLEDLRDFFKVLLSETGVYTDAEINTFLGIAYKRIVEKCECFVDYRSVSSIENRNEYLLDQENLLKILNVFYRGKQLDIYNETALMRDLLDRKFVSTSRTGVEIKKCYIKRYGKLFAVGLESVSGDNAATTTLSGAMDTTQTDVPCTSLTDFTHIGSLLIGTEVIHYTYQDDAGANGAIRGAENTTAALHNSDVTVTNRDIIMKVVPTPVDLTLDAQEPIAVEEAYRHLIAYQALEYASISRKKPEELVNIRELLKDGTAEYKAKYNFKEPAKILKIRPFNVKYA